MNKKNKYICNILDYNFPCYMYIEDTKNGNGIREILRNFA